MEATRRLLSSLELNTVCQSARCPNQAECFARHTATFLILGPTCTRHCRFCAVETGRPAPPDPAEPRRVARAVKSLGLRHAVVTSVTRDDLADGGAGHFAAVLEAIHAVNPGVTVEVLTPDFRGNEKAVETVARAGPEVFNHNVETVPRLYRRVRPGADFQRSLQVLSLAKELNPGLRTKSGLMVGLGEKPAEVLAVLEALRAARVDAVTIGQYLAPSKEHLPVEEFVHPDQFAAYERAAKGLGFAYVASAPFVRSSYRADEFTALPAGGAAESASGR